jgi:hypothetical protein
VISDALRDHPAMGIVPPGYIFDTVRVCSSPETEESGYAGRVGRVHGVTVPSETGVGPVIGEVGDGAAIKVDFPDLDEGAWFAPSLVESVDEDSVPLVTSFSIGGVTLERDATGEWVPVDVPVEGHHERPSFLRRLAQLLRRN